MSAEEQHQNRQLGGYKAALHNPNVSAEAKEHATAEHGIPVDESHASHIPAHDSAHHNQVAGQYGHRDGKDVEHHSQEHHSHYHTRHGEEHVKDEAHVVGGHKATLSNPNTSEEAKLHARDMLLEHEKKTSEGSEPMLEIQWARGRD